MLVIFLSVILSVLCERKPVVSMASEIVLQLLQLFSAI